VNLAGQVLLQQSLFTGYDVCTDQLEIQVLVEYAPIELIGISTHRIAIAFGGPLFKASLTNSVTSPAHPNDNVHPAPPWPYE
jgi:hypothetical protein